MSSSVSRPSNETARSGPIAKITETSAERVFAAVNTRFPWALKVKVVNQRSVPSWDQAALHAAPSKQLNKLLALIEQETRG